VIVTKQHGSDDGFQEDDVVVDIATETEEYVTPIIEVLHHTEEDNEGLTFILCDVKTCWSKWKYEHCN